MPRFYLLRNDGTWSDAGDYPEQPDTRTEGTWVAGEPGEEIPSWFVNSNPMNAITDLITQGQEMMAGDPLPDDIQEQIFTLEPLVTNLLRRQAYGIARNKINAFVIAEDHPSVTNDQRTMVAALKAQMLALLPE